MTEDQTVLAAAREAALIWLDTEFIEDGKTIELLSIGMVRDDGATYYAEVEGVDYSRADPWLQINVFPYLQGGDVLRTREQIAADIVAFAGPKPEFWGYYADYDWVALCQLYGRMIDLPKGWPMFCRDLKQLAEGKELPKQEGIEHHALADALWAKHAHAAINAYRQRTEGGVVKALEWEAKWYGSSPNKGCTIWEMTEHGTKRRDISYIGPDSEHLERGRAICAAHNAALIPGAGQASPAGGEDQGGRARDALTLPDGVEIQPFKPCVTINEEIGITEVTFEDAAYVAVPVFDGIHHWIDKHVAIEDGRLVGMAVWATTPPCQGGRAGDPPAPDVAALIERLPYDRDTLGRFVREAWVRWAKTQPAPKTSWLVDYDELSEPDKEADRQIGEAVAQWTIIGCEAITALRAKGGEGGWRDIASAPRDGTKFLAFESGRYFDCWWHADSVANEAYWMDEADTEPSPLCWMPLPTPPKAEGME